jgi:hypothetical protein
MGNYEKNLLKQVIKSYQVNDGATVRGAHRDAITDILHIIYKKDSPHFNIKEIKKECNESEYLKYKEQSTKELKNEAYSVFLEELQNEKLFNRRKK